MTRAWDDGLFDIMLRWQETGDLCGVATLGSCNQGCERELLRYVLGCMRLLVAYDVDTEVTRAPSGCCSSRRACTVSSRRYVRTSWRCGRLDWVRFELARAAKLCPAN